LTLVLSRLRPCRACAERGEQFARVFVGEVNGVWFRLRDHETQMRCARMAREFAQSGRRRREIVEGRQGIALADELRTRDPLEGDRLAVEHGLIAQQLDHADEPIGLPAIETDRRENCLQLDEARAGAGADRRDADRLAASQGLAQQRRQRDRRLRIPVRQKSGAAKLEAAFRLAEKAAGCFPDSLYAGVDILIDSRHRALVGEINAFGDLLPRLAHRGESAYVAIAKACFAQRCAM